MSTGTDEDCAGAVTTVVPTKGDSISVHEITKTASRPSQSEVSKPSDADKPGIATRRSSFQRARDVVPTGISPRGILEGVFVYGSQPRSSRMSTQSTCRSESALQSLPGLSNQVTVGRNSNFSGLTAQDREELGGVDPAQRLEVSRAARE
jgi:hypothetical protein